MFQMARRLAAEILEGLMRPETVLLPGYSRQRPPLRARLREAIWIVALALFGALYGFWLAALPPAFALILLAPVALLMLVVIWVLPDRPAAPTGMMTRFFLAFFIVSIVWPDYLALQLPGLPWISMRRMMLGPMILLLLVSLSTSARFRAAMKTQLAAFPLLWKLMAGFVAIQCASLIFADAMFEGIKDLVNYQTLWTAPFFVGAWAFADPRRRRLFLALFLGLCLLIGAIGIAEYANKGVLWANHIPPFLQVDLTNMAGTLASEYRNGLYRSKSVFNQPLPFAEIMALVSPVTLYFAARASSIWRKAGFYLLDLLVLIILFLPQSRLGLIGYGASHALWFLLHFARLWLLSRTSLTGPAITLAYPVLIVALAGAVMAVPALRERVIGGHDTIYSDQARKIQKRMAPAVIAQSPLVGHGPRHGASALGYRGGADGSRLTIDNYLLWIVLDYGILGFLLYYGMILIAIHRMARLGFGGRGEDHDQALLIAVILSTFLLIKTVLSEEDNHSLIFILLGMSIALRRALEPQPILPAIADPTSAGR